MNNAGISLEHGQKSSETSLQILKATYDTNVFGVVMVTNAMLPLLRKSDSGRIVNLSSAMGSLAYNSSKSALNSITLEYAKELRGTSIKINAVSPGYVADGPSGTFQDADGETPW